MMQEVRKDYRIGNNDEIRDYNRIRNNDGRKTVMVTKGFVDIPSFVFRDRSVAVLECLVEYMRDVYGFSYHDIALLLNRDDRTVWTVYRRAKLKRKGIIKHKHE